MIDLKTVRKLQIERIEMKAEAERQMKLSSHNFSAKQQETRFAEAEADIEKAEQDFPQFLELVEEKIIANIDSGADHYTHSFASTVRETYLVKMLLDVLPLHGFICRFDNGKLHISW